MGCGIGKSCRVSIQVLLSKLVIMRLGEKAEIETVEDKVVGPTIAGSLAGNSLGTILKRIVDISGSIAGLSLLSPIFIGIALAIRLDSQGEVIFKQKRIGKNGKEFVFYKFRSMYKDIDDKLHKEYMAKLINSGSDSDLMGRGGCFKIENDPRVTKVGRFLRKTSLDELPQLYNVLRGDMSLVGPRPAIPYEVEMYDAWHERRLSVIPGITGLWQVSGRSTKDFREMVELDLKYIDSWSIWLDLKIIFKTFFVVLNKQGAW